MNAPLAPFESRSRKLVSDWNAWVEGLHNQEPHKPSAAAYGICKKCRDYFDNAAKEELYANEGTKKEHADPDHEMDVDDNQFIDDDRDFDEICDGMDEARDLQVDEPSF